MPDVIKVNVIGMLYIGALNVSSLLAHIVLLLIIGIKPSNRTLAGAGHKSQFLTIINIEHPPPMHDSFNETDATLYLDSLREKIHNYMNFDLSRLPKICT